MLHTRRLVQEYQISLTYISNWYTCLKKREFFSITDMCYFLVFVVFIHINHATVVIVLKFLINQENPTGTCRLFVLCIHDSLEKFQTEQNTVHLNFTSF